MANCSDLSSFMPEHELVELLWENGQIVMQGQSNRTKKSSFGVTELAYNGRLEETDCGGDAAMLKFGKSGATDSVAHDLAPTVPCASLGMNAQDEGAAPWMNYPIDDSLHNDYCSEFFSELTGVNLSSLSNANNNLLPAERSTGYVQATKDSNMFRSSPGASELSRSRTSQLSNLSQQGQTLTQNAKSRVQDSGNDRGKCTYHSQCGDLQSTGLKKQDAGAPRPLQQSSTTGLMNFSHFSRPAALVKANLNSFDRLRSHEKSCSAASTYPAEPTLVDSTNGLKSLCGINRSFAASTMPKIDSASYGKPREDASRVHHNTLANRSTRSPDRLNCQPPSFASSLAVERNEAERGPEAVIASSSVCSGYSAGAASNDPKQKSEKRIREGEESGEHSDDLEDDSFAVKKPAAGRGTSAKRSRAAEVHNLSERRRRDRINEKMRALQELIPNCNKVDKASMLDEAIEYLKTLQLQVQMMSMGSGYCMPPMMLPAGMNIHPMHAPPVSPFSPLGVGMGMGMGMGMGFGMGMIDLNGSPGLIHVPPMHGSQFPCVSAPGVSGLHRMPPPSSIHSIGIHGQRLPFSIPHAPLFSSHEGPSRQGTIVNPLQVSDTSPSSSNKQQKQCINLEAKENASNKEPKSQTSQAVNPLMQTDSQELHGSRNVAADPIVNSSNTTETSSD